MSSSDNGDDDESTNNNRGQAVQHDGGACLCVVDDIHDAPRQPETLLAMCCRAVEAAGQGVHAEAALGGRERWHRVRTEALGPFTRLCPRLARPDAWDLAWYRPEAVDLVAQVRAIDRADPRLFPARNTSTMDAWLYAHADGRLARRFADTGRACVETLLRAECQQDASRARHDTQRHAKAHVCSLSLPEALVLGDALAGLIARRGGPRLAPGARGLVAGLRLVSQPRPLLACVPRLLANVLRWPPGRCALPVAPAYPFDHVVVAEWERDGMRGLVCVNANPAAAHDYGHASLVYLGAETFYAPCGMTLEHLVRLFVTNCRQAPLADSNATDAHCVCGEGDDFFTWAMRRCAGTCQNQTRH
ncbi:hypothetical protein pkur_cds_326 [Pandoravirus kuranda]|uniref:Uncharacterized protein n=1 Tax=Pandoravirus kuranda TaxID=3019033 RepID=A0AA95EMZ5_9VIRU|nr:hypothetical protein pkur_cds_326 [Pandoravirus kuranda]